MRKGEKAILVCAPEYAYGSRGTGPIPPAATLEFEVELLGWHEREGGMTLLAILSILLFAAFGGIIIYSLVNTRMKV